MVTCQPYEGVILFCIGLVFGVLCVLIWQIIRADFVANSTPAASLPSTENIEALTGNDTMITREGLRIKSVSVPNARIPKGIAKDPTGKSGWCPCCGEHHKRVNRPGDNTVLKMSFQYHCPACYADVFGRS